MCMKEDDEASKLINKMLYLFKKKTNDMTHFSQF